MGSVWPSAINNILNQLKTNFEAISTTNNYQTNVQEVLLYAKDFDLEDVDRYPRIMVISQQENVTYRHDIGGGSCPDDVLLPVEIIGVIYEMDEPSAVTKVHQLQQDISAAIKDDITLNGYVDHIEELSRQVLVWDQNHVHIVSITLQMTYREDPVL